MTRKVLLGELCPSRYNVSHELLVGVEHLFDEGGEFGFAGNVKVTIFPSRSQKKQSPAHKSKPG